MTQKLKKSILIEFIILIIVLLFLGFKTADAAEGPITIELINLRSDVVRVDTNGDGRLENFSADYTVYADGTAEGVVYLDTNLVVVLISGSIQPGQGDEVIVTAVGTDNQGQQHTITYTYDEMNNTRSMAGDYGLLLFDTSSSINHVFFVEVQLIIE